MFINNDWQEVLVNEWHADYFTKLLGFVEEEYETETVFPRKEEILKALELTSYAQTKVVIIGQDPYHGFGQAHGLSFSVMSGQKFPPSLRNIFKELQADLAYPFPTKGCLETWAKQGVLLLNTVLTVREGKPNSHQGKGWERFTDAIISRLNQRERPIVFILWGKHAQQKKQLLTNSLHLVIEAAHPSPLSANRGFFGSRPFSRTNHFLREMGQEEIEWRI